MDGLTGTKQSQRPHYIVWRHNKANMPLDMVTMETIFFSLLQIKLMQLTCVCEEVICNFSLCYSDDKNTKSIAVPQISSKTGTDVTKEALNCRPTVQYKSPWRTIPDSHKLIPLAKSLLNGNSTVTNNKILQLLQTALVSDKKIKQ